MWPSCSATRRRVAERLGHIRRRVAEQLDHKIVSVWPTDALESRSIAASRTLPIPNEESPRSPRATAPLLRTGCPPVETDREVTFSPAAGQCHTTRSESPQVPTHPFPVSRSLFPVPRSLFPVPCSPFPVPRSPSSPRQQLVDRLTGGKDRHRAAAVIRERIVGIDSQMAIHRCPEVIGSQWSVGRIFAFRVR